MLTLKHFKQACLFIALTLSLIWANLLKADDDNINPIADYRFDENTWLSGEENQVIDSSSNEYHARAIGVQPTTRGKICNAADFSNNNTSTGDFIELKSDLLSNENKEFTISLWFKTSHSGEIILLSGANASEYNELIWAHETSKKFKPWIDGAAGSNISLDDFSDNLWRHFVWRRNESQSCFYVNGDRIGCTTNKDVQLNIERLIIGQEQDSLGGGFDPSQRFRGLLDELLIFDTSISDEQIKAIYNNQSKGLHWDGAQWSKNSCTKIEPVGEYLFDEISWAESVTDNVIDSSDRNNNATAFGVQPSRQNEGKICSAANFDTTNTTDYIKLRNELLNGTEQFTISLWFKSDYKGIQPLISGAKNNDAHNEILWWHNNNKFQLHIRHDYLGNEFAIDDFANGNWQHWVWRRAGKTSCVFLDGVNLACIASKAGPVSIEALIVGQEQDRLEGGFQSTQRIRGLLDELLIFDKAISDSQIQTIYQNQDAGRRWNKDEEQLNTPRACNYAVDHYRLILNDNSGLTCDDESIEIKVCLDDDCLSTLAKPSTVRFKKTTVLDDTQSSSSSEDTLSFTGNQTVQVSQTKPAKVSYSFVNDSDSPEAKNGFSCYVNGSKVDVSHGCYTKFADTGFKISKISDQIAGTSFTANFEALKKGDGGACENIFEGNQNIKFTYNPILPIAASSMDNAFTINDTAISSNTEVEVNFNKFDSHKATLDINYLDAGKISFTASADLILSDSIADDESLPNDETDFGRIRTILDTSQQIIATSNSFVVRPDRFEIEVDGLPEPSATDSSGAVFKMAGETFNFNVRAVNEEGSTTTNFRNEEISGTVDIISPELHDLQAPKEDVPYDHTVYKGKLTVLSPVIFKKGVAIIGEAHFSEVGIITINAKLPVNNYLNYGGHEGQNLISGSLPNVGRFIPAQFSLIESYANHSCDKFTYFGQDFHMHYEIEAQNKQGSIVQNYHTSVNTNTNNNFAKAEVENLIENEEEGNYKSAEHLAHRYSLASRKTVWRKGIYRLSPHDARLERITSDGPTSPMTKVHPLVKLNDPDKEYAGADYKGLLDLDQNANELGGSQEYYDSKSLVLDEDELLEMRFGRLVVGDAYGDENKSLQIPLKAEYWNGTNFVLNEMDLCTAYSKGDLKVEPNHDVDGDENEHFEFGTYPKNAGQIGLELVAPNKPSVFRVEYKLESEVIYGSRKWLQYDWNGDGNYNNNPSGELQFGAFRGNDRVIYWREN